MFYLETGDSLDIMRSMEDSCMDAVITDPPYGLKFMGKTWDHGVPGVPYWEEALRLLKPGGYLLAFGGTRTHHRLMVAIEDAGFEIRDCLMWLYGSGFPKSLDVSKAIDKAAGVEREVVGAAKNWGASTAAGGKTGYGDYAGAWQITAPYTEAAQQWDGWGTALKPAWEPIILARKPLIGTVAANVLQHGTGGLNIDGCRIGTNGEKTGGSGKPKKRTAAYGDFAGNDGNETSDQGRWPANVVLDKEAGALLDSQSGERKTGGQGHNGEAKHGYSGGWKNRKPGNIPDTGGASRFFYCAKASRSERGEGNDHPTVKPIALMRYLVRLVTPPNGYVLDPFMGSGSTGCAAIAEEKHFIGFDLDQHNVDIAQARIEKGIEPID